MGYGTRNNGCIKTFWPDDTEDEFWLQSDVCSVTLAEIVEKAKEKWGGDIDLASVSITAEYVHTDCLTYDAYDGGDWTHFIKVERKV